MVNYTGRGLVVKRPGVLSKVQLLNVVLGVGVFSLLPKNTATPKPDLGDIRLLGAHKYAAIFHVGWEALS